MAVVILEDPRKTVKSSQKSVESSRIRKRCTSSPLWQAQCPILLLTCIDMPYGAHLLSYSLRLGNPQPQGHTCQVCQGLTSCFVVMGLCYNLTRCWNRSLLEEQGWRALGQRIFLCRGGRLHACQPDTLYSWTLTCHCPCLPWVLLKRMSSIFTWLGIVEEAPVNQSVSHLFVLAEDSNLKIFTSLTSDTVILCTHLPSFSSNFVIW